MSPDNYLEYKNTTFREVIYRGRFPLKYRCSCCGDGVLRFKADEFHSSETRSSIINKGHEDWDPEWTSYVFSASLVCQNCESTFYVSGTGSVEEDWSEYEGRIFNDFYLPKFFIPSIHLFKIPKNTPDRIKEIIEAAFTLAWADYSASGNKLRVALERIIDELVPNSDKSLGNKINSLPKERADIKAKLNAIKWLGNQSSHAASLEECDIAVAFKVTEKVLLALYPEYDDTENLMEQVKLINKNKGSIVNSTVI